MEIVFGIWILSALVFFYWALKSTDPVMALLNNIIALLFLMPGFILYIVDVNSTTQMQQFCYDKPALEYCVDVPKIK